MKRKELEQIMKVADHAEKEIYMKAGNGSLRLEITLKFRDKQLEFYTDQMDRKQFTNLNFETIYKNIDEWHLEEVLES